MNSHTFCVIILCFWGIGAYVNIMRIKFKHIVSLFVFTMLFMACSGTKNLHFLCDESQIEIYVDGVYVGSGQVSYLIPSGTELISVECRNNGNVVYQRNYRPNLYENNTLIEISIPQNYMYKSRNSSEY